MIKIKPGGVKEIQSALDKIDEMRSDDRDVDITASDDPQIRGALDFVLTIMPKELRKKATLDEKVETLRTYLEYAGELN